MAGAPGSLGSADGAGAAARFHAPEGIAVDSAGNVFVADAGNNAIRKVTPQGCGQHVRRAAGDARERGHERGARRVFWAPFGLALDRAGNLYVAELANSAIRKITPDAVVTTLAGLAGDAGSADGTGRHAQFRNPWGPGGGCRRQCVCDGREQFDHPQDHARRPGDDAGGRAAGVLGSADGAGDVARFWEPRGVALDRAGNLYVCDSGNHAIRKISPGGVVTTFAGLAGNPGNVGWRGGGTRGLPVRRASL